MPQLQTVGDLAARNKTTATRIGYVLESRGIEPSGRIGGYRVYDEAAAKRVSDALAEIAAAKIRPTRRKVG